jgi:hypothetical protein
VTACCRPFDHARRRALGGVISYINYWLFSSHVMRIYLISRDYTFSDVMDDEFTRYQFSLIPPACTGRDYSMHQVIGCLANVRQIKSNYAIVNGAPVHLLRLANRLSSTAAVYHPFQPLVDKIYNSWAHMCKRLHNGSYTWMDQ